MGLADGLSSGGNLGSGSDLRGSGGLTSGSGDSLGSGGLGGSTSSLLGLSSNGGSSNGSGFGLALGFVLLVSSFLDIGGKSLFVLSSELLLSLVSQNLGLLEDSLSSKSSLSDESLDLRRFVEGLVTFLDFSSDNILSNIISLSEGEDLSDVVGSLGTKSSGLVTISNTFDISITLLDDSEGNNSKIGSADASSD